MAQASLTKRFIDLDLNFTSHPVTKDVVKIYDDNAIIASLKHLLFTNFYERPFQPDVGSNLRGLLFENADSFTANRIQRSIVETIQNYEPRVKVTRLTVKPNIDQNNYSCEMEFLLINKTDPTTITFFLERVR